MKLTELLSIVENKFAVPEGADYHNLMPELEANLGSPDTDIRENSLEILWAWASKGVLTDTELIELGNRMAANLSVGLGESETDSVFLRAFSVLILNGVIFTDSSFSEGKLEGRKSFLKADLLNKWLDQSIELFITEQDLRGYVPIKKWAHSIAHCSDIFREISLHSLTKKDGHLKILDAIAKKLTQPTQFTFSAFEEGRICRAIAAIQIRNLVSLEDYEKWLDKIFTPFIGVIWFEEETQDPSKFNFRLNTRVNLRLFLSTLYLMLLIGIPEVSKIDESTYKKIVQNRDSLLEMITQRQKKMHNYNLYVQPKSD